MKKALHLCYCALQVHCDRRYIVPLSKSIIATTPPQPQGTVTSSKSDACLYGVSKRDECNGSVSGLSRREEDKAQ